MTTLNIEGKLVPCPNPPIYYVKSLGTVVDIKLNHAEANESFERCTSQFREVWKLDDKGLMHCIRRMYLGHDSALVQP